MIEVLVTVAIVAVMAALMLPALNSQLAKGDTGRLAVDLTSIQTGAQAFVSNVRRYPDGVIQLTSAITASSTDINGVVFPGALVAKWHGPYLKRDAGYTAGGVILMTFSSTPNGNGVNFVAITVTGVSAYDFANVELVLDEGVSGASSTNGSVRYNAASSILTFLALPIQ